MSVVRAFLLGVSACLSLSSVFLFFVCLLCFVLFCFVLFCFVLGVDYSLFPFGGNCALDRPTVKMIF